MQIFLPIRIQNAFFATFLPVSPGMLKVFMLVIAACATHAWGFGGAFGVADPGCSACQTPNVATLGCFCPNSANPTMSFRAINDCPGPGVLHGGNIDICASAASAAFGGAFEVDDNVPGNEGCRAANPFTGSCSCPAGYQSSFRTRTLVDTTAGGIIGSHIYWCLGSAAGNGFGGVYQVLDSGTCRVANDFTGSCQCPSGYTSGGLRTIVDGPTGATTFVCTVPTPPNPSQVTLCPGVVVDATGATDVSASVQQCIDSLSAGGTLAFPAGIYGLANQIVIKQGVTLRSAAIALNDQRICAYSQNIPIGGCATLRALPGCCQSGGMLFINSGVSNFVMNHMIMDGNRAARINTPQSALCINGGDRSPAYNAHSSGCQNCSFVRMASINALCGTGFEYVGDSCLFDSNAFMNNGNHYDGRWSDGLTLLQCQNGNLRNNVFQDNTDVNLIMGCGAGTVVTNVKVHMVGQACFAGFMMDNFNGGTCGNYAGAQISRLRIECGTQQCDFGVNLGPHAWYQSAPITGGTVSGVKVIGAKQGVNCGGAGTQASPVTLVNLNIGPVPSSAHFNCGNMATSQLNINPGSFVNRDGQDAPAATNNVWHGCP